MARRKHILAVFCAVCALSAAAPAAAGTLVTRADRATLAQMNKARTSRGLPPLRLDLRLQRAARAHSLDMLRRDYFAHGAFAERLARFDVRGPRVGENLAWGTGSRGSAGAIVRAWLRSPGHRRNLLRPGFRRVGVAAVLGNFAGHRGARMVTADFAGH